MFHYIFLHGFGIGSDRGRIFVNYFKDNYNIEVHSPDLNIPSFAQITYTQSLKVITSLVETISQNNDRKIRFIGSSMGGYLAMRYAQLNPEKVDRLILLGPGIGDIKKRWTNRIGAEAMELWKQNGFWQWTYNIPTKIHYGFIEDGSTHPPFPEFTQPALIIHGTQDELVPIDIIRNYARTRSNVQVKEVQDEHSLSNSAGFVLKELGPFFGLNISCI